jgi:hypothetical protein
MVKGHLPSFSLAATQGLLPCSLESSQTMKCLNSNDRKQVIQIINKQYTKHYLNIVLKDSTHHYECVSTRIS